MNKLSLNDTALYQLLGTDGIEELKSKVIDMIIEEIRHQLSDSYNYIISPDDISDAIVEKVTEEVADEVKEFYKQRVMEITEKKLYSIMVG